MEQPPGTDDLQTPQDLSASALPTVLDLTGRGEDPCALVRGNPGWYLPADSNSTGLPDSAPCGAQRGGHIQPDNAFSHTTVTLSYVSRSHVFSTHDSLSGNSSLYGVPTFSKYSFQPRCELGESAIALNVDSVDGASDVAAQTELLQSLSQAQMELEANAKQTYELNRDRISNAVLQSDSTEKHNVSCNDILQNGENLWLHQSLEFCAASLPECSVAMKMSETLDDDSGSLCKKSDCFRDLHDSLPSSPTVLPECSQSVQNSESLLESSKSSMDFSQECLEFFPESSELVPVSSQSIAEHLGSSNTVPDTLDGLGHSLQTSPENFVQSTAPSGECHEPDNVEHLNRDSPEVVFVSCTSEKTVDRPLGDIILEDPESPSATSLDNIDIFMLPEASSSPSGDNSLVEAADDDLSSSQQTTQVTSEGDTAGSPSDKCQVLRLTSVLEPFVDLTEDNYTTQVFKENLNNTKVPNDKAKVQKRKLPVRSRRGMHLEDVVMNINSSRYNVSGCIRTGKKSPQTDCKMTLRKSNRLSRSDNKCESKEKPKVLPKKKKTRASPENCMRSTSDSELRSPTRSLKASPVRLKRKSSKIQSAQSVNSQESLKDSGLDLANGNASSVEAGSSKSPPKSQRKTKNMAPSKKPRPRAKTKCTPKKKRKIFKGRAASSMFSPKEPEIKLKYVNFKEEKRDSKTDRFQPFVRVQRKEKAPSLCTVVNYPDQVKTPSKRNQSHASSTAYVSSAIPTTSCLRLGRAMMQGEQQRALVCCLCGQSANAMDLGDLHGPYYSEGYKPPVQRSNGGSGSKEEESSDSEMSDSECSGRSRKWTTPKGKPSPWGSVEGKSPAAKRARTDAEDWYSPPMVPLGPCEYWLHEDCGVWSAGVFLVRGGVYGLEEAVRAAHTTKCSSCGATGASLGCLFKGCTNKYHYRCALHSDCVLMEENFSIRCRKHKNKSLKGPESGRRDDGRRDDGRRDDGRRDGR